MRNAAQKINCKIYLLQKFFCVYYFFSRALQLKKKNMFSDTALAATSLGLLTLVALRWNTLPEDIRAVQIVVNYVWHYGSLQFKNRGTFSTNVDSREYYPRPPRTVALPPTPPRNYKRSTVSADADISEDSGEEAAEAKELDLKEDRGESEQGEDSEEETKEPVEKEEQEEEQKEEETEEVDAEEEGEKSGDETSK